MSGRYTRYFHFYTRPTHPEPDKTRFFGQLRQFFRVLYLFYRVPERFIGSWYRFIDHPDHFIGVPYRFIGFKSVLSGFRNILLTSRVFYRVADPEKAVDNNRDQQPRTKRPVERAAQEGGRKYQSVE
jgi:hypothetical protein